MNPITTIEYGVPLNGMRVTIRIFDIVGRVLRTLVDEPRHAGIHTVVWDGRSDDGRPVASGVYFYEARIEDYRVTKKLVILK